MGARLTPWSVIACAPLVGLALVHACADPMPPPTTRVDPGEGAILPDGTTFRRTALLTSVAACVDREQRAFLDETRALEAATDEYVMQVL